VKQTLRSPRHRLRLNGCTLSTECEYNKVITKSFRPTKCPSSLKQGGFIHQLEKKNVLKVIPTYHFTVPFHFFIVMVVV